MKAIKKIIYQLHTEVQDALNQPEPHDYYERLERIESLVKKLRATSEISTEQDTRNQSETCQFCDSDDVFRKGLCYGCFEDQYSDGARW
jgi:hypothetical protein